MNAEPHYLIVETWTGDSDEVFEVEHPASCPVVVLGHDWGDFPITSVDCLVGHLEGECGLDEYFHHADDPDDAVGRDVVAPGRHAIEGWEIRHVSYEHPDEYDSGLKLTEVTP